MLTIQSQRVGFGRCSRDETPCQFSDAVSVCVNFRFRDLVSSPFLCLPLCHFGDLVTECLRGEEVAFLVGWKFAMTRKTDAVYPFSKRQMVARCSETALGCHAFGIGFRVATFLHWRCSCRTLADVSTFADLAMGLTWFKKGRWSPDVLQWLLVAVFSG